MVTKHQQNVNPGSVSLFSNHILQISVIYLEDRVAVAMYFCCHIFLEEDAESSLLISLF